MSEDTRLTSTDVAADRDASVSKQEPIDVLGGAPSPEPQNDSDIEEQLALKSLEKRRAEKRRKRRLKIALACVLAGGIGAVALGRGLGAPPEQVEEMATETAVVERKHFVNEVSASGALKAGSTVVVTPEVDGTIESIHVAEGDHVEEGDILFTLKNDALDKAVHNAERDLETARKAVSSAQNGVNQAQQARDDAWNRYNDAFAKADAAHMEWEYTKNNYDQLHADWQARRDAADALACGQPAALPPEPSDHNSEEHKRWVEKFNEYNAQAESYQAYIDALALVGDEPQPAGVEPEYPEAPDDVSLVAAINSAQEAVDTANDGLVKAQEAYDQAVEDGEKRTVKAPTSGSVVAVGAKVGEKVGGGSGGSAESNTTPLVQISDVNKMAVDIEVNEIDILSIEKGQKATCTFSAVSGVEASARVTEVSSVATGGGEGGVVTFHVGLTIPKPDSKLRAGMTANVKIRTIDVKDAIVVPAAAVSEGADGWVVDVVVDEETMETEERRVEVSERGSSEYVIASGLSEGEVVLLNSDSDGFMG